MPLVEHQRVAMGVLRLAGTFTLVFELGFVVVVFTRFRPIAAVAGMLFHLGTYAMIGISFFPLLLLYGIFFDWTEMVRTFGAAYRTAPVAPSGPADRSVPGTGRR